MIVFSPLVRLFFAFNGTFDNINITELRLINRRLCPLTVHAIC